MLRRALFLSPARTEADAPPAGLPDGWAAIQRAAFDDDDYDYVPMSMDQATAIAKAVATARGLHFLRPYALPNPFVYRLRCHALGTPTAD